MAVDPEAYETMLNSLYFIRKNIARMWHVLMVTTSEALREKETCDGLFYAIADMQRIVSGMHEVIGYCILRELDTPEMQIEMEQHKHEGLLDEMEHLLEALKDDQNREDDHAAGGGYAQGRTGASADCAGEQG